MEVILASASPRRKELLEQIGWTPVICSSAFAEAKTAEEAGEKAAAFSISTDGLSPADILPLYNSIGKAKYIEKDHPDKPVIAADTIVLIDGRILGKPADVSDAKRMLAELSGRTHQVKTGVAVCFKGQIKTAVVTTDVTFREMSEREIDDYISSGEPMDKAGAYGIQGRGAVFVSSISGSYSNVVGLPLSVTYRLCNALMSV